MSITYGRKGGRAVMEKKRRLRGDELIRDRDRLMWRTFCEGKEVADVATLFGHTPSYVYRRFKAMPSEIKVRIRREVHRQRESLKATLRDEIEARAHA